MNILIVYGTTEGQTRKIAEFLKEEGTKLHHEVVLSDATQNPPDPANFDAVLIASSMHMEKYQTSIWDYVRKHYQALNAMHSAFISVSLTAASDEEKSWTELKQITDKFLQFAGWKPRMLEYTAGALRFTEYDFMKKFVMRLIAKKTGHSRDASHDTEYTDWKKLNAFLKNFIDTWAPVAVTVQPDDSDQEAVG